MNVYEIQSPNIFGISVSMVNQEQIFQYSLLPVIINLNLITGLQPELQRILCFSGLYTTSPPCYQDPSWHLTLTFTQEAQGWQCEPLAHETLDLAHVWRKHVRRAMCIHRESW